MLAGWELWLLLVGLAVGAAGATLLFLRLPREDDDIGEVERGIEAAWISDAIERYGGIAPASLTEEVLDLHRAYLATPRPPAPVGASAPPMPATGPPPGLPGPAAAGAPLPSGAAVSSGASVPSVAAAPPGAPPPGPHGAAAAPPPPGLAPPGSTPPPGYAPPPPPGPRPGPPTGR